MGYDLVAYYDNVDQKEINDFIITNNIDRDDWDQGNVIANYYKEKYLNETDLNVNYTWNDSCKIHEFWDIHSTSFIRDDERLSNRVYHSFLEKQVGETFPDCLRSINWTLRNADNAIQVYNAIRLFFPEDRSLMRFADWLQKTSKYCSIYELRS